MVTTTLTSRFKTLVILLIEAFVISIHWNCNSRSQIFHGLL